MNIIQYLTKLGCGLNAVELAKKKPVQMLFAAEVDMRNLLTPLLSSGREPTHKQLVDAILGGMTNIRSDVSKFYEDRYDIKYKNVSAPVNDLRQAELIASSYKEAVYDRIPDYESKKDALASLEYRIDTISATQSAQAINDQREFLLKKISKYKIWNAELDNTCNVCMRLHKKRINIGRSFGRVAPVHTNCRCTIIYTDKNGKEII